MPETTQIAALCSSGCVVRRAEDGQKVAFDLERGQQGKVSATNLKAALVKMGGATLAPQSWQRRYTSTSARLRKGERGSAASISRIG